MSHLKNVIRETGTKECENKPVVMRCVGLMFAAVSD